MKSLSKLKKTFDTFSELIWRLGRFEESFSNVLWVDANLMQQTHASCQFTAKPTLSMDLSCRVYRRTAHKDACLTRILLLLGCAIWSVYQNPTKSPSPFTSKQSLGTSGLNSIQYFIQCFLCSISCNIPPLQVLEHGEPMSLKATGTG